MKIKFYSEKIQRFGLMVALLLVISLPVYSQSPAWLWAKAMGGLGNDYGNSIALDASGNSLVTGYFSGNADFDPGPGVVNLMSAGLNDIFVTKTDGNGNLLWAKRIGGASNDFCWSVTTDISGNIIFTGNYSGTIDFDPGAGIANLTASGYADIFVCKLDNAGNFIWAKSMGGPDNDDYGYSVVTDASGNVYTTGVFSGSADFNPATPGTFNMTSAGGPDIFISKLNSSGTFEWAKAIGGIDYENGFAVTTDASNNIYATGYFSGTADFNPGPSQVANLTSAGYFDAFVMKLNTTGDFQWAKKMGGPDDDFGSGIAVDATGNVYTVGHFQGTADFDPGTASANLTSSGSADVYVSKLNDAGNFVWAKSVGGSGYDDGFSIAVDGSGNVYAAGRFIGIADFNPGSGIAQLIAAGWGDLFVVKLNSTGNFEWAKAAGGINDDVCKSITADASGYIYLTGNFLSNSIAFGTYSLSSNTGTSEVFIAKLDNTLTGIAEAAAGNNLLIYPNPVKEYFTITIPGNYQHAEISLTDISGKKIPVTVITTVGGEKQEITVYLPEYGLEAGIYVVQMATSNIVATQKLMVVR